MSLTSAILLALLVLGGIAGARWWQRSGTKVRVRPPPRSRKPDESFQATNGVAKLFTEVVALEDEGAQWPRVLQSLNAQDEPRIRTLLLELRRSNTADPRAALAAMRLACMQAKREGADLSRTDLLERALSLL